MHRSEIENAATASERYRGHALDERRGDDAGTPGEAGRCLASYRAYEASRQMLAALGRRRQPLD